MDFAPISAVTFDCYGTLIDWETGILGALRPCFDRSGAVPDRNAVLRAYAAHERAVESGPYVPYREVLRRTMRALADEFALDLAPGEDNALADSLKDWPAFEETPGCLRVLQSRYTIGVLSNIDDDLFALSQPKLGVVPGLLVTAQQVQSYKPGRAHFDEALRRLDLPPSRVLHVAESRYHDVAPARALGFATVWVNRAGDTGSPSASGIAEVAPHLEVRTLRELVKSLGLA